MRLVDPRACGVDRKIKSELANAMGGSPRMRGRRAKLVARVLVSRWIPAHAG